MKKESINSISQVKIKKRSFTQGLPVHNPNAAGIDVGDTKHDVAIRDDIGSFEVHEYGCFTESLKAIVTWLVSKGITTVAMESTGVYWLNLYLMLEEAGIEPYLVNAKHVKNVTGRKKDDTDAIWLQKLHSCGLLQKCFQPEATTRKLRTYVRQRRNLTRISSDSVNRMQKAMELMNIKLHTVISQIIGKTGLQMVVAIIKGERDPEKLIAFKDPRIKANDDDIKKSLEGIWRDEYLFMLEQAYDEYLFYQSQLKACDERIKDLLLAYSVKVHKGDIIEIKTPRKKKPKKNEFSFEIRSVLKAIVGVDLCKVEGINENSALELISEIGTDMSKWKSNKHFSAWLNVAPNTKITGGKIISSKMQKKKNNAGQTLRMSASSLSRSKTPLGDFSRKMKSRLGKKGGVIATAHKLARIIYTMILYQQEFDTNIIASEQEKWKMTKINYLEKQLKELKKVA